MELYVYSRDALARVTPHEVPHVVISITSAESDVARFPIPSTCRAVLRLAFADLVPSEVDASMRELLFRESQAQEIWRFVDAHAPHVERIVVHCDAGHSRSPAVAAAIARAFAIDDTSFFRRHEPNRYVLDLMLKTRGLAPVGDASAP